MVVDVLDQLRKSAYPDTHEFTETLESTQRAFERLHNDSRFRNGNDVIRYDVKENIQRQFYRLGFEVLGEKHPVIDAELILIAFNF